MNIYKHYTQAQLNDQYNNRLHVPDFAAYLSRWEQTSLTVAAQHANFADIPYGNLARERLDIFPGNKHCTKVLVFIHGGYWQLFDKAMFHFIAPAFLRYNVTTVLINYPLAPAATMDQIVAATRKAMLWLQQNLQTYHVPTTDVYVAGHSAGAHLAAMLAADAALTNTHFIKGMCLLSGLYNLIPIQLSNRNEILQMDTATAIRNSPVYSTAVNTCPLLIAAGAAETAEFKAQSQEFWQSSLKKATPADLLLLDGLHHFSIPNAFVDADSALHKAMRQLMDV